MRRSAKGKFTFIVLLIILAPLSVMASGGGGNGGGEAKPAAAPAEKKMRGSFSEEDMEQMRLYQYLQGISSPNYQVAEKATFYFEQRGAIRVPDLMRWLKRYNDDDKRISAVIYTFGRMGKNSARAVPIIMQYLDYENEEIRKTTMSALGKIGPASEPAVPKIAKFLESKDEWTRLLALRSLKNIGTPQAKEIAELYEKNIRMEEARQNQKLLDAGHGEAEAGKEEGVKDKK